MSDEAQFPEPAKKKAKRKKTLKPQWQRFAMEYVIDFDEVAAYQRAGFKTKSPATARVGAFRLLRNPLIKAEIAALKDKIASKIAVGATMCAQECWEEFAIIGRSTVADIWDVTGDEWKLRPPKDIPKYALRAIKSVEQRTVVRKDGTEISSLKITMHDKLNALTTRLKGLRELSGDTTQNNYFVGADVEVIRPYPPPDRPLPIIHAVDANGHANGNNGHAGSGGVGADDADDADADGDDDIEVVPRGG